ncbi:MAG TPA: SRPBCC domain-containing protein, partial [Candidatus Acidoferrum sp.]|nr:SRPBCC domain-containing protein [Candidatus Acidoferrum sp.]
MVTPTDRIEKKILLRAPHERVWRAITDAKQFGNWFGVAFDGDFVAGARITGTIVPTKVDAEVAKLQESHTGAKFAFHVDRIEPMRLFSFRWHPFAVDP